MPPRAVDFVDVAAALAHLSGVDPVMGRLIAQVGPFLMRVEPPASSFTALGRAILSQQLSGKAAATIIRRLSESFGSARFPTPTQVLLAPVSQLRAAGLSGAKAAALRELAERVQDGTVPTLAKMRRMEEEALVERLTQVRGVGRWTVEMVLMFRLGKPDVLPLGDYGVRKGFMRTYGLPALPTSRQLEAHGEAWRPYRTVASWYLWRALEL
jgi:DNA-3-methyladenine glycosylase II